MLFRSVGELIKYLTERAHSLCLLERYADSLSDWDRAISLANDEASASLEEDRADAAAMATTNPDQALVGRVAFEQAREYSSLARIALIEQFDEPIEGENPANRFTERALERLVKAKANGYIEQPGVMNQLMTVPDFEPLRSHSGFQKIITEAGKSTL